MGFREYAHMTATGKAILAYQSAQVVNDYLKKTEFKQLTIHSVKDAAELLNLLDDVREQGYACDNE